MKRLLITVLLLSLLGMTSATAVAKNDDFGTVVKVIEDFYDVKHQSLPLMARAGIKTATVAARLSGGTRKRLAEAGSVRVAFFEDQEFNSKGGIADFRARVTSVLAGKWLPFIQVLSPGDEAQTYIFLKDSGPKYLVLVVTIDKREASVVQVMLAPQTLAMLMQDPNEMGKAINDDAFDNDNQE